MVIDGEIYEGTPGFWSLVVQKVQKLVVMVLIILNITSGGLNLPKSAIFKAIYQLLKLKIPTKIGVAG